MREMSMKQYLAMVREEHQREEEERRRKWEKLGAALTMFAFSLMCAVAIVGWPF